MEEIDVVTVVNNFDIYNKCFTNNLNLINCNLILYDNTKENKTIPIRFNDYLGKNIELNKWIIFCHQDFLFQENIHLAINSNLSKDCIYGPVGADLKKQFVFFIRFKGLKIAKLKAGFVEKQVIVGNMFENTNNLLKISGKKVKNSSIVNTLDCCCFIIHSSLLRLINFRFDEKLNWHLYSEDLCLFALNKFNIKSKIINFKATHFSGGNFDDDFEKSLMYLKKKHSPHPIVSTCFDGVYEGFTKTL